MAETDVTEWVIDTNVLIVATTAQQGCPPRIIVERGDDVPVKAQEDLQTVFAWLEAVRASKHIHVVLDFPHRLIEAEYAKKISKHEYGRMVIANKLTRGQYKPVFVDPDEHGDAWIPHESAEKVKDRADRRMVAAALESGAQIVNACDTDWHELLHNGALAELGVSVHHLLEVWCRAEWIRKRDER